MKKLTAIIIALGILFSVCPGAFSAENILNLDFSNVQENFPHQTRFNYNNIEVVTFHLGNSGAGGTNTVVDGGPCGKYLKSSTNSSNVAYFFPGKDFAKNTKKITIFEYTIRQTNSNKVRSNLRTASASNSDGFYDWVNNQLKIISKGSYVKTIDMDPEKYYEFTFIIDMSDASWIFYMDGEYIGKYYFNPNHNWSDGFFYITIQNYGDATLNGETHLDNIRLTFMEEDGIDLYPFAENIEDGKFVDAFSAEGTEHSMGLYVINPLSEEMPLMIGNAVYKYFGDYRLLSGYSIYKKTLSPGVNRIEVSEPVIPSEEETGELMLLDSIYGMKSYGNVAINKGN